MGEFSPSACDTQFFNLLTREPGRPVRVDLAELALEIARDAFPDLNFSATLGWINDRAGEVTDRVRRSGSRTDTAIELGWCQELGRCLAGRHGVTGQPKPARSPQGGYLNRVVETGSGLPVCLAILYLSVGDRLGLSLDVVSAPRRVLLSCELPSREQEKTGKRVFIDPFARGRVLPESRCVRWLTATSRLSQTELDAALEPLDHRTVAIRLLQKLSAEHLRRGDWAAAWPVHHRLAALSPRSVRERLNLGIVSIMAGRPGQGLDLLQSCFSEICDDEQSRLLAYCREAERRLALLN